MSDQEYVSMVNSIISKYKLKELIGSGTTGGVFLAINRDNPQEEFAFKMQVYVAVEEMNWINFFIKEQPENWIKVYDTFKHKKWTCVVMQKAKHDLSHELQLQQDNKFQNEEDIKSIILQISIGIRLLHLKGSSHRDLKPENILKLYNGSFVLCDLGLITSDKREIKTMNVGTQYYMAPEQSFGKGDYNSAVDIWAIGIIMFEMKFGFFQPNDGHEQVIANSISQGFNIFQNPQLNEILNNTIRPDSKNRFKINELIDKLTYQTTQTQSGSRIKITRNNNVQQPIVPQQTQNRNDINTTVCYPNSSYTDMMMRLNSQPQPQQPKFQQEQPQPSPRIVFLNNYNNNQMKGQISQPDQKQIPQIGSTHLQQDKTKANVLPLKQKCECEILKKQIVEEKANNQELKEYIVALKSEIEGLKKNKPPIKPSQKPKNDDDTKINNPLQKNQDLEEQVQKLKQDFDQLTIELSYQQEQYTIISVQAKEFEQKNQDLSKNIEELKQNTAQRIKQDELQQQENLKFNNALEAELKREQSIMSQNSQIEVNQLMHQQVIVENMQLTYENSKWQELYQNMENEFNALKQNQQQHVQLQQQYKELWEQQNLSAEQVNKISDICGNQDYEQNMILIKNLIRILNIFKQYKDIQINLNELNELKNEANQMRSESNIILNEYLRLREFQAKYTVHQEYTVLFDKIVVRQPNESFLESLKDLLEPTIQKDITPKIDQEYITRIQNEITIDYHREKYNNEYFKSHQ